MALRSNIEMAMEVNPNKKPKVKPQKWLTINTDNLPITSAAELDPNIMHCIPLDFLHTANSEVDMWSG